MRTDRDRMAHSLPASNGIGYCYGCTSNTKPVFADSPGSEWALCGLCRVKTYCDWSCYPDPDKQPVWPVKEAANA